MSTELFHRGQTVRIHPATDLFMRGVAYAEVRRVATDGGLTLYHPRSKTTHKVSVAFVAEYIIDAESQWL